MSGVEDLFIRLRQSKLRWFGCVIKAGGVLGEVGEVRVWGQWPAGRPWKK